MSIVYRMISLPNEGEPGRDVSGMSPEELYQQAVAQSGPLPESMLYEMVVSEGKEVGFRLPPHYGGAVFRFKNGEQLVHLRPEGATERNTFIRTKEGKDIPVAQWIAEQKEGK